MSRKPNTSARTARRLAKVKSGPLTNLSELAGRVAVASKQLRGTEATRATKVVEAVIATGSAGNVPLKTVANDLASGGAAFRAGMMDHDAHTKRDDSPLQGAACRSGCAFCCILPGEDGGVITEHEATALYTVLADKAGQPDGRNWHPKACPALDPETKSCRAYDARPLICRAYFSTDVASCEAAVEGQTKGGTAVLGSYPLYLAVHALARALIGAPRTPTYSLVKVAAAAVDGATCDDALKRAKHAPRVLNEERGRVNVSA